MVEILKPDFVFSDDRGFLIQLVHNGYKQINAVYTKKNKSRGNFHYHRENNEAFFVVSGSIELHATFEGKIEEYRFKSGDMFLIKKNVKHSFNFLEDTYLVGLYDGNVELQDGTKDIFYD